MKKLVILLLYVLAFQPSFTIANNNKRAFILKYSNSSGEKGTSFFEFDGTGRMIKGRWQLDDTSRWSANYYLYNKHGQLIEKYREFSDSLVTSVYYSYDKNGLKSSEIFDGTDGRKGTSLFFYKDGIPEKIICNKHRGWFDGEIVFTEWESGKPTVAKISHKKGYSGVITYKYSQSGNLVKECWKVDNGWEQTFHWIYETPRPLFSSSNVFIQENSRFRLSNEKYSFNGESGGPSYFTYDESGAIIKKEFIRSDSLKTRTTFEYGVDGLLKKSVRHYSDGKTGVFKYQFNDKRKLISRLFKSPDGVSGSEKYAYNATGQLIKAEWENFDNWLTGVITFKTDRAGRLGKGFFKGKQFDADLTFSYDIYGNLSKIHWEFSFGKSQTYWFKYSNIE